MHLIGSSPNTRCPPNEEGLGTRENWETGVFIKMLVLRVPIQSQTNASAGFYFSDMMFKCSFEPVPGKEKGKKKISPFLQHQLILLLPLLFEIAGKLVPN